MIKPCVYSDPKIGADLAYQAAVGGCDVIKDDELIADVDFNPITERVTVFMEALDRADSEKGEKTLYTINITDRVERMFELADIVQEHGANALMVKSLFFRSSSIDLPFKGVISKILSPDTTRIIVCPGFPISTR